MASRKTLATEDLILRRWKIVLMQRIALERISLEHGRILPGTPMGIRHIPGETRRQRLVRWQDALITLEDEIALQISDIDAS